MSSIQSEVFEAFRAIDIPEEKAIKAAAALAKRDDDVISIKADIVVMKWMIGTTLGLVLTLLIRSFTH